MRPGFRVGIELGVVVSTELRARPSSTFGGEGSAVLPRLEIFTASTQLPMETRAHTHTHTHTYTHTYTWA